MKIAININQAALIASDLGNESRKLSNYRLIIHRIINQCSVSGSTKMAITQSLKKVLLEMGEEDTAVRGMQNGIYTAIQMYQRCEQNLAKCENSVSIDWSTAVSSAGGSSESAGFSDAGEYGRISAGGSGGGGGGRPGPSLPGVFDWSMKDWAELVEILGISESIKRNYSEVIGKDSLKMSGKFKDFNDDIKDELINDHKLTEIDRQSQYFDLDGNTVRGDVPDFYKQQLKVAELKNQIEANISYYDGTFGVGENSKINVVIGNAEAHSGISRGLYVVGKDGERKFSPGVNAEVGVSATALDLNWEQQWLGDEMFGLNSDVGVTVGKADATASIGAQIYGEDGELDLQLGANAKAEVIAAEAKGSVGVNVLGGEIGASGSVNFGIGAHADAGYKDGVLKFDVGASLGLGVSFGAEVDIGGMADTVCDAASSAWNDVRDGWNSFWGK